MADFLDSNNNSIQTTLDQLKFDLNLKQIELSPLSKPLTIEFYEKWLLKKYHGQMEYLEKHLPFKQNPKTINPEILSVISVAQTYFPLVKPYPSLPARIALYSQNEDYHHWLKEKLAVIIQRLQQQNPEHIFLPYVDSGPILERDLAYQNGLGWFGKNTCLIHPQHGSLFFIAEILTSLKPTTENNVKTYLPDFCGKCQKCIEICPTQALTAPRELKAERCISYLTIESKTAPPIELRSKIGDWFFGCDLCQTVCPWNEKAFKMQEIVKTNSTSTQINLQLTPAEKSELIKYFQFLLTSSYKKIQKHHLGTPLNRAGAKGLIRNALIVIANKKLIELSPEVHLYSKKTDWNELALWCLSVLEG